MTTRWLFAHVLNLGWVCFNTEDPVGETIKATKVTTIDLANKDTHKHAMYAGGFLKDPVFLGQLAITVACKAPKEMQEAAEAAWSGIALPGNGRFEA